MNRDKIQSGKLPQGWTLTILENLLDYIQPTSYIVSSTDYSNNYKTPVLTPGKSFILGYTNETEGIFDRLPVIIFDDFTTAIKWVNFPFKVKSSAMKILVPTHAGVNMKFIYYFMETLRINTDTHKRYWISVGAKSQIPLSPLNEQNRIVLKLDELLSELEKGKEQLQTSLEQLHLYRQSILKKAFESKSNFEGQKINQKWKEATLQQVCMEITDGSHFSPKATKEGYPYITVRDIKNDKVNFENSLKISKAEFDKLVYNGCKPNKGDVLFSKDGTVGKVSLVDFDKEFVVLSSIAILRTNKSIIEPKLLYYALKSTQFLNQALDQKKGVAIRRIILRDLKNLTLRFPEEKHQQNCLIEYFDSTFDSIDSLENELISRIAQSHSLHQSLLQEAFKGKLVEQDPNDEPASKLLERIKKEREEYFKGENAREKKEKPLIIKRENMAEELKRIMEILKESKEPVAAKTLWQSSTHKDDIDGFYAELKTHIEAGEIIELPRKGKESFLKLADER